MGVVVVGKGEPGISIRDPVPVILNAEMLLLEPFATYRNLPLRSTAAETGNKPTANGDPDTGVSEPLESMVNADTLKDPLFTT
jgi:hypothetical protein